MAELRRRAFGIIDSLAASGKRKLGTADCRDVRTFTVTTKVTYGAGTAGIRVNLYFSADGIHFDTIPYAYYDVNWTSAETCQETAIVDVPEHGYMEIEVENLDAAVAATSINIWTTAKKHPR